MMIARPRKCSRVSRHQGFTLPELLVVIGVIAVLIAVLLPALSSGLMTSKMAKSQNSLRQIALWTTDYSAEHRDAIVPSQFDYSAVAANKNIKVRSNASLQSTPWGDQRYKGTWADILWTLNGIGTSQSFETLDGQTSIPDVTIYYYDTPEADMYDASPLGDMYEINGMDNQNPFRAAAPNSRNYRPNCTDGTGPLPYGTGAREVNIAGFFAANNFFNSSPSAPPMPDPNGGPPIPTPANGRWYVTGQIKAPERSMYLVDSLAGETIEPEPFAFDGTPLWDCDGDGTPETGSMQVDFRYNGACLMMFLDGHNEPQSPWKELKDLEGCKSGAVSTAGRGIRVRNLTTLGLPPCP